MEDLVKKRARTRKYHDQHRSSVIQKLGGTCKICGEADGRVLQVCHLVPVRRKQRTSSDSGGSLMARIHNLSAEELAASFELLCANDHMRKTFDNKEWSARKE